MEAQVVKDYLGNVYVILFVSGNFAQPVAAVTLFHWEQLQRRVQQQVKEI